MSGAAKLARVHHSRGRWQGTRSLYECNNPWPLYECNDPWPLYAQDFAGYVQSAFALLTTSQLMVSAHDLKVARSLVMPDADC